MHLLELSVHLRFVHVIVCQFYLKQNCIYFKNCNAEVLRGKYTDVYNFL